jgi:4-hydroxyproline epimerase
MRVQVVDSHTGGEPTRLVVSGGPDLGGGSVRDRLARFRASHDRFRAGVVNEPRGNDAIVGALLCEPADPTCQFGVIFFNNVGYIGMCGHGTIGLVATLAHLGKIQTGTLKIETPVGVVSAESHGAGFVTVRNIPAYRHAKDVTVEVEGHGPVTGDVAWGGNWFYLTKGESPIELSLPNLEELTNLTWRIRRALVREKVTGKDGAEIDHIELFSKPHDPSAHSRNFVLCPGKSYDRSPCGTGTSAKMACLYTDSLLRPGGVWRQESITGSIFEGRIELQGEQIIPFVKGSAFVTAQSELVFDERDAFCWGIPNSSFT